MLLLLLLSQTKMINSFTTCQEKISTFLIYSLSDLYGLWLKKYFPTQRVDFSVCFFRKNVKKNLSKNEHHTTSLILWIFHLYKFQTKMGNAHKYVFKTVTPCAWVYFSVKGCVSKGHYSVNLNKMRFLRAAE